MMDSPFREDIEYQRDMIAGSTALALAINNGWAMNSRLKWTERTNAGTLQASEDARRYRTEGQRRVIQSIAHKEAALARRVSRDPCPVCATRMDIGCAHRRVA